MQDDADGATQAGGGDGASLPSGRYSPLETPDGRDTPPARLGAGEMSADDRAEVEEWIRLLPASATELFKRKFLRDHRRAQRVDR